MIEPRYLKTGDGAEVVLFSGKGTATLLGVDNLLVVRGDPAFLRRAAASRRPAGEKGDRQIEERAATIRRALRERLRVDPRALAAGPVTQLNVGNTTACNMRCSYCYHQLAGATAPRVTSMSSATARAMVDALIGQAGADDELALLFIGGESLVQKRLVYETVRYARGQETAGAPRIQFVLYTNGLLLSASVIDWAEREQVSVVVSLDGPPLLQDRHRRLANGGPSSEQVLRNVQALLSRAQTRQRRVRAVVTRPRRLLPLHRYLLALGFNELQVIPAYDRRGMAGRDQIPDLEELCAWYETLLLDGVIIAVEPFVTVLQRLVGRGGEVSNHVPCGAGISALGVAPSGDLVPCHHFIGEAEQVIGNVHRGMPDARARAAFWVPVAEREACRVCWARYLCGGECYHRVLAAGLGYAGVLEDSCVAKRHMIEQLVETFTNVADRRPNALRALLDNELTIPTPDERAYAATSLRPWSAGRRRRPGSAR